MLARWTMGVLVLLLLVGCKTGQGDDETEDTGDETVTAQFLALGDSYTIGERVDEAERWPVQLTKMLRAEGIAIDDPQIIAQTGWTTDELNRAIDSEKPQGPFDIVSLLIGVNNQYRGRDVEVYRGEFVALLGRATGFAGGEVSRVVVVSIPDWGVTPFAEGRDREQIAAEIDAYNAVAREETERVGATFVDITPHSRENGSTQVAPDGLHPSGAMYTYWAEQVLPVTLPILR